MDKLRGLTVLGVIALMLLLFGYTITGWHTQPWGPLSLAAVVLAVAVVVIGAALMLRRGSS